MGTELRRKVETIMKMSDMELGRQYNCTRNGVAVICELIKHENCNRRSIKVMYEDGHSVEVTPQYARKNITEIK